MMKASNFRLATILFTLLALLLLVIGQWSGAVMVAILTLMLPYLRRLAETGEETTALLRQLTADIRAPQEQP